MSDTTSTTSIKPKLAFFDLTMIVVSLVIGVGIFRTPAIVATKAGTPLIFFAVWILGGIISICGALTFAEIGSRLPVAGGFYKIFSHCYHPAYAFMLNWSLVITNAASAVGVAIVGAEYINPVLMPESLQNDMGIKITAMAVTLILFSLNYLGIKMGARTQNVLSMIKILMMIAFCFAAFNVHPVSHLSSAPEASGGMMDGILKALGVSLISVFFTYGGYQNTINFGADIEKPERNIPRSIFAGIGIVVILYLTINVAYVSALGFEGVKGSKLVAAELVKTFFGEKGFAITAVAIFISVLGFINTSMMHNPRMYYAMADDKILPEIFRRVNSKTMAQEFALSFFVGLMLLSLFMLGTFENILNYVMFIDSLSLVSAAGTIFIFRQRAKLQGTSEEHIYKMKWYPLVPLLFMFVLLMVTVNVVWSDPRSALYGFLIFLAGYPLYKWMKKMVVS
ncbi:MAG: amino acid permease [Bacteroidetes bacterium]|nr:amino acid permease [Bacteroidota bacterium]